MSFSHNNKYQRMVKEKLTYELNLPKATISSVFSKLYPIVVLLTFNNNDESLRSYGYVKDNSDELHVVDYIPPRAPIEEVEISAGSYRDIQGTGERSENCTPASTASGCDRKV